MCVCLHWFINKCWFCGGWRGGGAAGGASLIQLLRELNCLFLVFSILNYFNKISIPGLQLLVMYFRTIASVMPPLTHQHAQTKNNIFQRF